MTCEEQTVPNNTLQQSLSFSIVRFDVAAPNNLWGVPPPLTPLTRLTAKVAGKYQISGSVVWEANSGPPVGIRQLSIGVNSLLPGGKGIVDESFDAAAGTTRQAVSTLWDLNVGDYVELFVRQTSNGPLKILKVDALSPEFMMVKVA